jgi:hypothetical protein
VIDGERLWNRLFELAEIGKHEGGGVTRLSFTEEERAAPKNWSPRIWMRRASQSTRTP